MTQGGDIGIPVGLGGILHAVMLGIALLSAGRCHHSGSKGVFRREKLHRIGDIPVGVIVDTHGQQIKVGVQQVGPMVLGCHPVLHKIFGGSFALDIGDVLAQLFIVAGHHGETTGAVRPGMAEIPSQFPGTQGRSLVQGGIVAQIGLAIVPARLVGQGDDVPRRYLNYLFLRLAIVIRAAILGLASHLGSAALLRRRGLGRHRLGRGHRLSSGRRSRRH